MRRLVLIASLLAGALLLTVWATGGFDALSRWAAEFQRDFQNAMARSLRALRAGEPGAVTALLSASFAYGFVHAAGPGHGKVVIGGYGLTRRVPWARLTTLAFASSLAQGITAIVLVGAGVLIFGLTRESMTSLAEDLFAPVSYGAILALGLWLAWRGLRSLRRMPATAHDHHHHHDHDHDHNHDHDHHHDDEGVCATCGHAHGPTLAQTEAATTLREQIAIVAAIAARPCTGALFLLILTWRFGIFGLGVLGTLSMALGTASVTILVALAATGLRGGALWGLADRPTARLAAPVLELTAGLIVAALAFGLLLRSFA